MLQDQIFVSLLGNPWLRVFGAFAIECGPVQKRQADDYCKRISEIVFYKMLLSIICPTYNRTSFLEGCLALLQSLSDISLEFLIVDDASSDNSVQVVPQLQENYGAARVRYFLQSPNAGAQEARNRGIQEAQGELLMFVDSDDVLVPDCVAIYLNKLKK
jgi:glycosyltransferase involved in cell wall biosynthesis